MTSPCIICNLKAIGKFGLLSTGSSFSWVVPFINKIATISPLQFLVSSVWLCWCGVGELFLLQGELILLIYLVSQLPILWASICSRQQLHSYRNNRLREQHSLHHNLKKKKVKEKTPFQHVSPKSMQTRDMTLNINMELFCIISFSHSVTLL